jgi:hypothetical protein
VLRLDDTKPLWKALEQNGYEDIRDLLPLAIDDIESLKYTEKDANNKTITKDLLKPHAKLLECFLRYTKHRMVQGNPITDWTTVTQEEFDDFRSSTAWLIAGPPTGGATTAPRTRDPVQDFKKGIKRDPSNFTSLKDEKQWDNWKRTMLAQATAQDVAEVLDPTYAPTSIDDTRLFAEKQKYMYAVLEKNVQTDTGKRLVREHLNDYDAQEVFKKLTEHANKSTKASIEAAAKLSYVTSVKVGDGKWNGTASGFINHWVEQVRLYNDLVEPTQQIKGTMQRMLLENAVHPLEELRAVKNQADQHKVQGGKELTYDEYESLLLSAANNYDSQFKPKSGPNGRRAVYLHDTSDADADDQHQADDYDIDTPIDTILANAHNRNFSNRPRLQPEQWDKLDAESRNIWKSLPLAAKAVIIGHPTANSGTTKTSHPPSRSVNVHQLTALLHHLQTGSDDDDAFEDAAQDDIQQEDDEAEPADDNVLLSYLTDRAKLTKQQLDKIDSIPPSDLRKMLSSSKTRLDGEKKKPGTSTRSTNAHMVYRVSNHEYHKKESSLIDRGSNGGVAGEDVRVMWKPTNPKRVNVRGLDSHEVTDIPIATVGGVIETTRGKVIAVCHNYAVTGRGKTIHSCTQLEAFKNDVNDKSVLVPGGRQRIRTIDGYIIPLAIKDGLPYLKMRPYTDQELADLPQVILTDELDWDPTVLDHDPDDDDDAWHDANSDEKSELPDKRFDEFGDYRNRYTIQKTLASYHSHYSQKKTELAFFDAQETPNVVDLDAEQYFFDAEEDETTLDDIVDDCVLRHANLHQVNERGITKKPIDYEAMRPFFAWLPVNIIEKTFGLTTQYGRIPMSDVLKKWYKSPNPALNVHRRNEDIATDTVYSDTPAVDGGETSAQFFVGTKSGLCDVYGMKTDKQFVNTLEDQIRDRGAPTRLISDRAQVEISNKVQDILRALFIGSWQSEPHHQHQNPAERRYQQVKTTTNTLMDRTGSPAYTWLLCLMYVCFILNYTFNAAVNGVPINIATGTTNDISVLLRFHWWEPVYYKVDDSDFPSDSREESGHFVGISEHVGHAMTYKILADKTNKVVHRSNVRSALPGKARNLRIDPLGGEQQPFPFVKSRLDDLKTQFENSASENGETKTPSMPIFHPRDLVGRTFLMDKEEDGQRHRARIVKAIEDHEQELENDPDRIKFLISVGDERKEEIISYNEMLDHIQRDEEGTTVWKFKRITAHEGPLKDNHPNYKGSKYNVMVEWETGEITSEPLSIIAADDPVTCAIYARENGLLDKEGWKRFKRLARREKKMLRMVNQAKLRSYRSAPKYVYGYEVPKDYDHAIELDKRNGNTKWQDCTDLEMNQLHEYKTFKDLGYGAAAPQGYKKIKTHLVYTVKHDGRHKARMVADGHLTDVPTESVYSGVVSLRGLRMLVFLAELNNLETWSTDIGNAYLEADTKEKIYIHAGKEFGDLKGHTLIIVKALYGLRSSGLRWHERFAVCLDQMGFTPSKSEPDIWMRRNGDVYEYIAVYVDDLAIAAKDPQSIVDVLVNKYKFKLKGTGPISFHLGCDFFRDNDGVLCMQPKKYIDKMMSTYEHHFKSKPMKNVYSPLPHGDHPELDESELLDEDKTRLYQSLVGAMQWAISLGRFDISTAVMTLSSFRAAPRQGHLERVKRIYGFLARFRSATIRIRTAEPDYSSLPSFDFDWAHSVYGTPRELLPQDAPMPLGKYVTLTHFVDANLFHDMITGRSVTGILHFMNKTPIDWYSKKQATVETATYGSEFVAARTCVEQVIDLRLTLRYLGVPIRDKSYMFGDNKTVVESSVRPHAKLHKRHNALSFHRVREAIAAKIIDFYHIDSPANPADVLSKHWGYQQVWQLLQPILYWQGDTIDLVNLDELRK